MQFDPNNPVVKLCAEGMAMEAQGKTAEAHALFQQAWHQAADHFEAFTAAHYLARNQKTPEDQLRWNKESLKRALLIDDASIKGHYASLYLNIGKSYEMLNNRVEALQNYRMAAENSGFLGAGPYGDMIRSGISEALKRLGSSAYHHAKLESLVNSWCENKALKPLSFVLPAYVGNLGSEEDITKLVSALSFLSATRCVNAAEQKIIDEIIRELSKNFKTQGH